MLIQRPRQPNTQDKPAGEGSYLASASDLMIGLLFIFIFLQFIDGFIHDFLIGFKTDFIDKTRLFSAQ